MYKVTASELLSAASTCRSTNQEIQAQIARMRSLIDQIEAIYHGPASTQLQALSQQWKGDADQLNLVLSTIADGLTSNANNYVAGEDSASRSLVAVGAALPPARL